MQTNDILKKISFWSTIFIIVIALAGIFYVMYTVSNQTPKQIEEENVSLDTKAYEELSKPKDYGIDISTEEPGYGRANPFAPIK